MITYEGNDKFRVVVSDKIIILGADDVELIALESFTVKILREELADARAKIDMLLNDIEYLVAKSSGFKYDADIPFDWDK